MAKNIKLQAFPEEITEDGLKIYGETSFENQMAVLSHYLHNNEVKVTRKQKEEIISSVREFLSRKQFRQGLNDGELSDDEVWNVAESPLQYNLFDDFFNIPFPAPENPRFTFIDLFAGMGGFRIAMQRLGGKCVYSSEFKASAQKAYLANYGEMTSQRNRPKDTSLTILIFFAQASRARRSRQRVQGWGLPMKLAARSSLKWLGY